MTGNFEEPGKEAISGISRVCGRSTNKIAVMGGYSQTVITLGPRPNQSQNTTFPEPQGSSQLSKALL